MPVLGMSCAERVAALKAPFLLPKTDQIEPIRVEAFGDAGHVSVVHFENSDGWFIPFMFGRVPVLREFPGFARFGYETRRENEEKDWKGNPQILHVPDTATLNNVEQQLREHSPELASGFTFTSAGWVMSGEWAETVISSMYAQKRINVFEPSDTHSVSRDDEATIYHDKLVHALFWIMAGEDIANATSSRHSVLTQLREIFSEGPVHEVIKKATVFENQFADGLSAGFNYEATGNSLIKKIREVDHDEIKLLNERDTEGDLLISLYLLTRNGKSTLSYVDRDHIFLKTFENEASSFERAKYRAFENNIAPLLTLNQKFLVRKVWVSARGQPDISVEQLDQVRAAIHHRLTSR